MAMDTRSRESAPAHGARSQGASPAPPSPPSGGGGFGKTLGEAMPKIIMIIGVVLLIGVSLYAVGAIRTDTKSDTAKAAVPAVAHGPVGANGTVVNVKLTTVETDQQIVPAGAGSEPVTYHVWTFDGTAPGPVIRVHLGDTIHFNLHNASTMGMQHSIDFHAAMTPWANLPAAAGAPLTGNYQPVDPGQTKTFDWVAMYPGVFMYHCGVPPVLQHIANGMYGAIVVEPDNLPKEREYVLVNSEFYPGAQPIDGVYYGDPDAMASSNPQYVVWNGVADLYKANPLVAKPNEKFRIWVVNAGPTLTSAFHVIGTMFDVYADGNPANVIYGDQTYNIPPGGGAMFELQVPDPGLYPFVTHAFAFTGRGAVGLVKIDPAAPAAPDSYPLMGDPFTAGIKAFAPPASVADVVGIGAASPTAPAPQPSGTGAAGGSGSAASCKPNGTALTASAMNMAFDASCLAAPANKPFTIAFNNMDPGVPHNISIYADSSATKALFTGDLVTGPGTITYKVGALPAGTYVFRCDVHPTQMTGTFVVG